MRVLTIDIDYIVNDSWRYEALDNKYWEDYRSSEDVWDYWEKVDDILDEQKLTIDNDRWHFIRKLHDESVKDTDQVFYIMEHHDIYPLICRDQDIEMVLVDQHHDMSTGCSFLHEGNWGHHLMDQMKSIVWIKNPSSHLKGSYHFTDKAQSGTRGVMNEKISVINQDEYRHRKFDKVITCLSPEYVHPQFWWTFRKLKNNYLKIRYSEGKDWSDDGDNDQRSD